MDAHKCGVFLNIGNEKDKKEIIELLINHGADVNARDKFNQTPLNYAVIRDRKEIISLLKKHGAK
ncbi:MAG: ankyrin repeat domain-containing protein [Crocosphaera sp.]